MIEWNKRMHRKWYTHSFESINWVYHQLREDLLFLCIRHTCVELNEKHMMRIIPLNKIALNKSEWTKKMKPNEMKRRFFVYKKFAAKRYRHSMSKTDLIWSDHWPLRVLGVIIVLSCYRKGKTRSAATFNSCSLNHVRRWQPLFAIYAPTLETHSLRRLVLRRYNDSFVRAAQKQLSRMHYWAISVIAQKGIRRLSIRMNRIAQAGCCYKNLYTRTENVVFGVVIMWHEAYTW